MKEQNTKNLCSTTLSGSKPCKSINKGFTLTEVIIVIAIMAALALILIPNMLKMMPDDHNIKYKKAFNTIQQIAYDIANECQGKYCESGECYSVDEWNELHPDDTKDSTDNSLSFCYNSDKTPKYLGEEICKRLNTIDSCNTYLKDGHYWNVKTTNGMKWFLPNNKSLGTGKKWGFVPPENRYTDIYVSLDGNDITDVSNVQQYRDGYGIYAIRINSYGKVFPVVTSDNKERNLLLDNPTND